MLRGIMADTEFAAQDHAGNFRPQFFPGIPVAPKRVRQVAVQPGRVAGPVAQFMQCSRIVIGRTRNCPLSGR